jgi:hypothetical protein
MTDAIREKAFEVAMTAMLDPQMLRFCAAGGADGEEFARAFLNSKLRAAIDAFEAAMWQTMESAPKNGKTVLLGLRNRLGNWRTLRGCWLSQTDIDDNFEEPDLFEPGWYETAEETEECWPVSPTRWRVLPPPPKEENKP